MRPRPLRPSKRQRPSVQPWSGMQSLCAQSPSGRQRLPVQVMPIPCNNPLVKVCKTSYEALGKEGQDCQSFLEACRAALQACPPEAHGVLMYPLQLLTENMSLASLLVTTPNWPLQLGTHPTTPPPTMSETPAPPTGTKQWCCSSDWEVASPRSGEEDATVLDMMLEEWPHWRQKDGRPLAKLLKESHWEAFSKDSEIVNAARWAYHLLHKWMFAKEGSYNLTSVFCKMATSASHLDSDVHEVQDEWTGQKDLWATHQAVKSSPKDIYFFWLVPLKSWT